VRGAIRRCKQLEVVQRYQSVERDMQGRPSVVVAPSCPPAARGEALMRPWRCMSLRRRGIGFIVGALCAAVPLIPSISAASRRPRPVLYREAPDDRGSCTVANNTYPAVCTSLSACIPNSDAMPLHSSPQASALALAPDPGMHPEVLLHNSHFRTSS
jgi:hypothetical protein